MRGRSLLVFAAAMAAPTAAAASFDCARAVVDGVKYDLHDLGGPRTVVTSKYMGATYTNTSYTVDICRTLERSGEVPKGDECPMGTRACAIRRLISLDGKIDSISEVIAIAGDLEIQGGGALDAKLTRLSPDDKTSVKRDGLRVVFQGGAHFLDSPSKTKRKQRAVVDFLCDEDKTGTEGFWTPEDHWKGDGGDGKDDNKDDNKDAKKDDKEDDKEDDKKDGKKDGKRALGTIQGESDGGTDGGEDDGSKRDHDEHQLKYATSSLIWDSYGPSEAGEDKVDVLKLTWYTKLVCPAAVSPGNEPSSGWGFFSWLVVVVFLGIASYLIFGSWLNYNRFGARGWDLLPHGDFIRDFPYLVSDWLRRVLNTVQGAGSRGGYTAV